MPRDIHIVKWNDHFHRSSWHDPKGVLGDSIEVETVGFLSGESKREIALSTSMTCGDAVFTQVILKKCITSHQVWEVE